MKDAFIKGNGLFNTSTKYVYSEKRYFERTMIHFGKEIKLESCKYIVQKSWACFKISWSGTRRRSEVQRVKSVYLYILYVSELLNVSKGCATTETQTETILKFFNDGQLDYLKSLDG